MKDIGFALVPSPEWKLPILLYHIAPGQESVSGKGKDCGMGTSYMWVGFYLTADISKIH
ncbi:Uncharacterized protein APZ42_024980 [Daphnia magna]|uniref:Uncharacterized protein n=1 Tax=Daphnia magna TaxID=35525 RepID=A0A164TKN0_9CRUS|nr:Uncharacterized protein APZ42_024980 [Daphnia magna]